MVSHFLPGVLSDDKGPHCSQEQIVFGAHLVNGDGAEKTFAKGIVPIVDFYRF